MSDMPTEWGMFDLAVINVACGMVYRRCRDDETWAEFVSAAALQTPWSREGFIEVVRAHATAIDNAIVHFR